MVLVPQILNSHPLHVTPGSHPCGWGTFPPLGLSRVYQQLGSQGNQGHKTQFIQNRCGYNPFSSISILNTWLKLPVVF